MRTRPAPTALRSTARSVVVAATLVLALPRLAAPSASGMPRSSCSTTSSACAARGLDVPDPTVDADGNLVLGGGGAGGGSGTGQPPRVDPDAFAKAQEVCGDIPTGALGLDDQDMTDIQDAALRFAKCMRAEGVDVPDPDFSRGLGQGAAGPFGNLDTDDPKVAAALEKCQSELGSLRVGGGGSRS